MNTKLFSNEIYPEYNFSIKALRATINPQTAVYMAMHQCYSDKPVQEPTSLSEIECGEIIVKRLLEGGKGHYSPFEQATITIVLGYLPHSLLQQLLRSRIGLSPSIQSFRYTSLHIIEAALGTRPIEDVIYLRPVGKYFDRDPGGYDYTPARRERDLIHSINVVNYVATLLNEGMPPEQARGLLNFDYRQHGLITLNARSMMAILDRRSKKDAQIEIRILSELIMNKFKLWMPHVGIWYEENRYKKALLSP